MSTRRWAGASLGLLFVCFGAGGGCGGDDSNPGGGDAGVGGDAPASCSTNVTRVESSCKLVSQNGRQFELGCSSTVSTVIDGRAVCATSGQCVNGCLDQAMLSSCLQNCRLQDAGGDGGGSPLGTECASNADCGGGLTCLKPTDNIVPGAGPPNGLCTMECPTAASEMLCKSSFGGTCITLSSSPSGKSFCMETCATGPVASIFDKCHGREDMICAALDPAGFGCVPLCASDADCGTRKCDLGSGLCADVVTPGAPIGSPCTVDNNCAGNFCYPFDIAPDASSSGVCTAVCRLGTLEGCKFRTGALDAGPPVGACLLSTPSADEGDIGICAQLCDSVSDCTTTDPRWTCIFDNIVRSFGHAGYCWLGVRPDGGGPRDASAPDVAPETGAPESGTPETGAPETGADVAPESGSDATPDSAGDTPAPPSDGPTE